MIISFMRRNFNQTSPNFLQISCQFIIILRQATLKRMEMEYKLNKAQQCQKDQEKKGLSKLSHQQVEQYQLISRYLCLKSTQQIFLEQQSQSNQKFDDNSENKSNQTRSSASTPIISRKDNKKTSDFHNFQKHLMTTLKKYIKMKRTSNSSRSKSSIACQLWEYFLTKSKSCKREILCLLIGSIGKNGEANQSKYKEEYVQLIDYFDQYTQKEINSAQEYLCREVIRQSHKLLQSHSFQNRRINKSDDFKNYFKIFIAGLEEGKLSIRLPKNTKSIQQSLKNDFEVKSKEN